MKNKLIIGVAKSGKTTYAKKLCEKGKYNYIPLDYFTSSFKHNFPECNITSSVIINEKTSSKLSLFLSRVVDIMNNDDNNYIIDSAHLFPHNIIEYIDRDKWDIYCLGYPNIDTKEKLDLIRKHSSNYGWTNNKTDEELYDIIEELKNISKILKEECIKYNIEFIDTGSDFTIF